MERQTNRKCTASTLHALNRHAAAMQRDNFLDHIQPNTHAADLFFIHIIRPIEATKQPLERIMGDADSLVSYRHAD